MKKEMMLTLDAELIDAAERKALEDRRTLKGYVAHLIKKDVAGSNGVVVSVTAPDDVRSYTPLSSDDESEDLVRQRNAVMDALLTAGGH